VSIDSRANHGVSGSQPGLLIDDVSVMLGGPTRLAMLTKLSAPPSLSNCQDHVRAGVLQAQIAFREGVRRENLELLEQVVEVDLVLADFEALDRILAQSDWPASALAGRLPTPVCLFLL
jgi:hypothetical protein